jgi:hypothetical protein
MAENDGKDWRELCAAAAEEPDSEKLVSLVNQILQAFDERDQGVILSGRPLRSRDLRDSSLTNP